MSRCYIIIDDRERAIITLLDCQNGPWWRTERLNYGDYALMSPTGTTLAIIERKTYSDFAQSIKDNRIANFAGLTTLREHNHDVRLMILLEGQRPATSINGIPIKCIRAKINHLILRDDFHLIETTSAMDTAQYLQDLAIDASSLHEPRANANANASTINGACIALQKKTPISIEDDARNVFMEFPGIGEKTACQLINSGISIAEFVTGIESHTNKSFARLSSIYQSKRNCATDCLATDCAALMAIHGVSRKIAERLIGSMNCAPSSIDNNHSPLQNICALSRDDVVQHISTCTSATIVRRKLGERVYDCLHYKGNV